MKLFFSRKEYFYLLNKFNSNKSFYLPLIQSIRVTPTFQMIGNEVTPFFIQIMLNYGQIKQKGTNPQ